MKFKHHFRRVCLSFLFSSAFIRTIRVSSLVCWFFNFQMRFHAPLKAPRTSSIIGNVRVRSNELPRRSTFLLYWIFFPIIQRISDFPLYFSEISVTTQNKITKYTRKGARSRQLNTRIDPWNVDKFIELTRQTHSVNRLNYSEFHVSNSHIYRIKDTHLIHWYRRKVYLKSVAFASSGNFQVSCSILNAFGSLPVTRFTVSYKSAPSNGPPLSSFQFNQGLRPIFSAFAALNI